MMFALLASCVIAFGTEEPAPRSCVLYVRTADDWAPLRAGPAELEVVPMTSRSAIFPRAAHTSRGIGFRLWAGASVRCALDSVRMRAIEHAADSRILIDAESQRPILAESPRLPRVLASRPELQPWLSREDWNGVPDWSESLASTGLGDGPQPELRQLLARAQGSYPPSKDGTIGGGLYEHWNGFHVAWPGERWENGSTLDALIEADFSTLPDTRGQTCRLISAQVGNAELARWSPWNGHGPLWPVLRWSAPDHEVAESVRDADTSRAELEPGAFVELWFEAPRAAADGMTWTFLLTRRGDLGPLDRPADAPRFTTRPRTGQFVDVAHDVGIDMVHFEGPELQLDIRPTMGPGAAWGDVDGDGWVDLFLPQGGGREGSEPPTSRFYRNDGGTRFVDESTQRGLALSGAGMGTLFYDADGDGDLDLFVANYGRNRFLLNDGQGKFTDASDAVGLETDLWHAAVSAADYDGDGDLDLFVTSYLQYDTTRMPDDEELGRYQREDPIEMLPFAFPGERKCLLRCDLTPGVEGASPTIRYVDVAKDLGLDDPNGRGMQAIWLDFDRDGDPDLVLANDVSPNRFWRNEGDGSFKDVGFSTGLDDPRGCMGLAAGDVDGDLDEDLFVTNWQLESNALYVNNLRHTSARSRVATFRDRSVDAGLAQLSVGVTGWGSELADFDLDGDLDLVYANGYTSPDYESTGICVAQPCHYFVNDGAGNFRAAFEEAGPDLAIPLASRAAVACDFDQDGDLDVAITANNGRFRLLRNETPRSEQHWLGLRLRGAGANTHAIGAQVVVESGGRKLLRALRAGTGYLSGNAPELHFGLGEATSVTSCTVRWPSGKETTHAIERVDGFVTIGEPR
jgi:hypothetical protein